MESSRGLVASIAALGLVVAAAITLLVITGAPLDFRDWPSSPKPRPAPGGQGEVLGERAQGGEARSAPSLVALPDLERTAPVTGTRRPRTRRTRRSLGSKVTPRGRARHRFGRGRNRGRKPTSPPSPPTPVTPPPSIPVSAPVPAPEPPWSRHWEEKRELNRPGPGEEGEGGTKPKPKPTKPWPKPGPRPKPRPQPQQPPASVPPAEEPDDDEDDGGDDDKGEEDDDHRGGDDDSGDHGGGWSRGRDRGRSGWKGRGSRSRGGRR